MPTFSCSVPLSNREANLSWGADTHYQRLYMEKYVRINPLFPALLFYEPGEVFAVSDVIPTVQHRRTRFYKEWQQPQGLVDAVAAILEKSRTSCAMVAVPRHERNGLVDASSRERMRLIVPHVRRAVLISKAIDLQTAAAATLADAFDALSAAVYLVDERGRVVHANRSGAALVAEDDILHASGDCLRPRDPAIDRLLREIFAAAAIGNDLAVASKGSAISLSARNGERYAVHVLPLSGGARQQARRKHAAAVAVFVHKAALDRPTVVEAVTERFRLTAAELRVLFAIIEVGGVPEVAPVLGIAEGTVKTHLKRVFAKTGTNRQADLVKLVSEFANPLVG